MGKLWGHCGKMVNKGEHMVIYGAYSRELGKSNAMNGDYSNNEEKNGGYRWIFCISDRAFMYD